MVVGREVNGRIQVVDRMKEMVRLAAGLNEANELEPEAADRALSVLGRFGQRLRDLAPDGVRAVGTNTLRKAQNSSEFIREARGRECKIVEPQAIYTDILATQVKSITGKEVPASEFDPIVQAAQ